MQAGNDGRARRDSLNRAIREATALGQMFAATVASRYGLGATDLEYLDIVAMRGRVTAGEIAEATGLTTGGVTGVIDRLERAGFVQRERDPEDRRRVFVTAIPEKLEEVGRHYRAMAEAVDRLAATYSDAELDLFLDYFRRAAEIMRTEFARLKGEARA